MSTVNLIRHEQAKDFKCIGPAPLGNERDGVRYCVGTQCMAWKRARTYLGDIQEFAREGEDLPALFARCHLGCCGYSFPTEEDLKRPGVSYAD